MPTADVNGISIYYELHGDGYPLLLIGGLGTDVTVLAYAIERLARRYRVIALDNRGVGRSGMPDAPYTIDLMAADVVALMDRLAIPKAHVMGVSMGGRIALEVAMTHPERVDGLVLVSTSAAGRGRVHMSVPMRLLWLLRWLPMLRGAYPQPRYAHDRQRAAVVSYDGTARLGLVRARTLVLHGKSDRTVPLAAARRMRDGIAGSRLEVYRGGHMLFLLSRRDRVLDRAADFLAGPTTP